MYPTNNNDIFSLVRNLDFGDLKASFSRYRLNFHTPAKTSRDVLKHRDVWYLKVYEKSNPSVCGVGECAPIWGLSQETEEEVENALIDLCADINNWDFLMQSVLINTPSVLFALEQALIDLYNGGNCILFPTKFTEGNELIQINGLIWMGDPQYMINQINEKIEKGFLCLKLKIGGLKFQEELHIISEIRNNFSSEEIELRLDANGAFSFNNALDKLESLAEFDIHSIEQPIKPGQWAEMAEICQNSPIPIALDEELIGVHSQDECEELMDNILPHYLILKPSLIGGFQMAEEWIELANQFETNWWVTSALESNIGLNHLAQWTFKLQNPVHHGLGTGALFTNNIDSPIYLDGEHLKFDPSKKRKLDF